MKLRKPDYFDRFRCIAGACKDSCCIGWEIDVDADRQKEYRKVTGELGERLKRCIDWEEGHFILQGKEERCPFLNGENLCDLIIGLGEESLCDICREHPRYYEWYEELTEAGVGLCCEEAARLVLECEQPAAFVTEETDETGDEADDENQGEDAKEGAETADEEDAETLEVLMDARETAYKILQNRELSIWERLELFLTYVDELQDGIEFGNLDEIEESAEYYRSLELQKELNAEDALEDNAGAECGSECDSEKTEGSEEVLDDEALEVLHEMIQVCRELEPMDESWPKTLDELENLLDSGATFKTITSKMEQEYSERDYEYEHLAVYFVYRYFMKCRNDSDLYSKGLLAVFFVCLVHLLDVLVYAKTGTLSKADRAWNAKNCSKEIEYSEENLARLAEMFWEREMVSIDAFRSLLLYKFR